jgi:hypothetical protein
MKYCRRYIKKVVENVIDVDFKTASNERSSNMAYEDDDIDMKAYLKACGYKSVEEWALDSDFEYDDDQDIWFNDEGNPVDIEEQLYYVIDSLTEE